ncbi:hypothetical protein [Hydrogenivirga sp.]
MKIEFIRGREGLREFLQGVELRDVTYLFNREKGRVDYILLLAGNSHGDSLVLVDIRDTESSFPLSLLNLIENSQNFQSALEAIDSSQTFACIDPTSTEVSDLLEPNRDIAVIREKLLMDEEPHYISVNLFAKRKVSAGELRELLTSGDTQRLNETLLEERTELDLETVREVLSKCEGYKPETLEVFLGHALFRLIDEEESRELYELFSEAMDRVSSSDLKKVFAEKRIYAYARCVEGGEGSDSYHELKNMLEGYLRSELPPQERAFILYEVITSLRIDNPEVLKDMLYSFDRYIPYDEEFSPLIFGDLGMSFYNKWEDAETEEYRELSLVLLQKSLFSVRELLRLRKTQDMPINLSNIFAYLSVLIPMLAEEVERSSSEEVRERKRSDIVSSLCLGIHLFLKFAPEVSLDTFSEVYTTDEDARVMVESTYDNFLSMMEAYFDCAVESESEEAWDEVVSENPSPEELTEGALKVREIICS